MRLLLPFAAAVACLGMQACHPSTPLPPRVATTPLTELRGERIEFSMCGRRVSLPRAAVSKIGSDGRDGLAPRIETSLSLWLASDRLPDSRVHAHDTFAMYLTCANKRPGQLHPTFRSRSLSMRELQAASGRSVLPQAEYLPATGLVRFRWLGAEMDGRDTFMDPARAPAEGGFVMDCNKKQRDPEVLTTCEIQSHPAPEFELWFSFHPGSLEHWRAYRSMGLDFFRFEDNPGPASKAGEPPFR